MPTPSMEDYLERIYLLMVEKGYARVSDIAEHLGVHPSSVTKMVQKLDREEYLIYEKYRGLMLTKKGQKIGKRLVARHAMLESFLRLIGVDEAHVYEDVEGIEHHLSSNTLDCMTQFVEFFEDKPELMAQFHAFQELKKTDDE
ncbi:transcriptional regulator MntR [Exiguobacterium sp. AM39-5BH]|uniref:transcriptional regulator MntR n=1 Tax=Exiguobacterium sp. AM39-5BH TaxID=2292355 RepID=UPI000FE1A961|nr:transcriptional regulator MntR [Exiguobacterium sp. AM39-5BH]RHB51864.1 transcriptional regulator MntR [Exiguobacterium sp. AM39-5BH]